MNGTAAAPAPSEPMPPHPFRASPWYDPTDEHQPCVCAECEAKRRKKSRPWVLVTKTVLVACGGVVLPLVSVLINHLMGNDGEQVVQLGVGGTLAIALSVLTTLAHLLISPVKRDLETGLALHQPPQGTPLRVVLFVGSLLGCITWGYLALLFLPLLPISFIAIIFLGFGLCGLCPYGALAIHVIQAVRGYRSLRARLPRRPVVALLLGSLLLPVLSLAAVGISNYDGRHRLDGRINAITSMAPHGVERMKAFAALRGLEGHLVDRYMLSETVVEQALLAEAHLRLTDEPIHSAVQDRNSKRSRALIRPWWFLDGSEAMQHNRFWRF